MEESKSGKADKAKVHIEAAYSFVYMSNLNPQGAARAQEILEAELAAALERAVGRASEELAGMVLGE